MSDPQYKWTNDQGEWVHTFNQEIANKALFNGSLVYRDGVEVINHYDIFEEEKMSAGNEWLELWPEMRQLMGERFTFTIHPHGIEISDEDEDRMTEIEIEDLNQAFSDVLKYLKDNQ